MAEYDEIPWARLISPPKKHPLVILLYGWLILSGFCVFIAVKYSWGPPPDPKDTPQVETSSSRNGTAFSITITEVTKENPLISKVNYILLNETGRAVTGMHGSLWSIYGLNFNGMSTNVTFIDLDYNQRLSRGDYFLVKHVENGGVAREGYFLLLRFTRNGEPMNGGGTRLG